MTEYKEQRAHYRVDAILHVKYGEDASILGAAFTKNISLGGLFISTNYPLDVGMKIFVHLFVSKNVDPIIADCEVMWTRSKDIRGRPPGMGVKFMNIDNEDLERIRSILQKSQ